MSDFRFLFLTRPGCHLCDDARPLVTRAAARAGVELSEIDVDTDDELTARYGLRIPVVLDPTGDVLAEGPTDDGRALTRAMRAAAGI